MGQTGGPDRTLIRSIPSADSRLAVLLHFDRGAGVDELLLDRLRLFLADAFLHRLGSAIDQVFGFLQTEAGDFANSLDHVDFICARDRKSTRLNSSHLGISYAVFCLKKKT